MIEKVELFPIEEYYFLESPDFLIHREKFYFRSNKTIKLNSFWIGVSTLRVNNDKLLYLYNGLRGYYEVKTRYLKEPKLMEKKVPLSKKTFVNDYLIKKYKYSDLFIYSLNIFDRPTITLKKENYNNIYYSFPYRLAEYLNKKSELINLYNANEEFYYKAKEMKYLGYRFQIKRRKKYKGWRRLIYLNSISIGFTEDIVRQNLIYRDFINKQNRRVARIALEKTRDKRRRKLKKFRKFFRTPIAMRFVFLAIKKYLTSKNRLYGKMINKKINFKKDKKKIFKKRYHMKTIKEFRKKKIGNVKKRLKSKKMKKRLKSKKIKRTSREIYITAKTRLNNLDKLKKSKKIKNKRIKVNYKLRNIKKR